MVAARLDLIADNAVEIGGDYETIITLCNQPDLSSYDGFSNIRDRSGQILQIVPSVLVSNPTAFRFRIPGAATRGLLENVTVEYDYDVLFVSHNLIPGHRFFAVRGKIAFLATITLSPRPGSAEEEIRSSGETEES